MPRYYLNKSTGRLHIEGYCPQSKPRPSPDVVFYESEQEATNAAGKFLMMCKICDKKREQQVISLQEKPIRIQ